MASVFGIHYISRHDDAPGRLWLVLWAVVDIFAAIVVICSLGCLSTGWSLTIRWQQLMRKHPRLKEDA